MAGLWFSELLSFRKLPREDARPSEMTAATQSFEAMLVENPVANKCPCIGVSDRYGKGSLCRVWTSYGEMIPQDPLPWCYVGRECSSRGASHSDPPSWAGLESGHWWIHCSILPGKPTRLSIPNSHKLQKRVMRGKASKDQI